LRSSFPGGKMPPSTSGRMPDATLLRNSGSVNLGGDLRKTGHPPQRRPGRAPQIFGNGRVRLSAESRYAPFAEISAGAMPLNAAGGGDSRRRTGVAPVSIFKKVHSLFAVCQPFRQTPAFKAPCLCLETGATPVLLHRSGSDTCRFHGRKITPAHGARAMGCSPHAVVDESCVPDYRTMTSGGRTTTSGGRTTITGGPTMTSS